MMYFAAKSESERGVWIETLRIGNSCTQTYAHVHSTRINTHTHTRTHTHTHTQTHNVIQYSHQCK